MILQVSDWSSFSSQIRHGFGSRHSEHWTHQNGRCWVKQTHSADVVRADSPGFQGEGDALVTDQPGLLLEIRTADCISVLLFDPQKNVVAAVHSGWKGTCASITGKTVEKMSEWYGVNPQNILAAIGPAIRECCYEVGPEVSAEFGIEGRVRLDLAGFCRKQLLSAGVQQIVDLNICTMCNTDQFYSFRREKEKAGRMETAIELLRA